MLCMVIQILRWDLLNKKTLINRHNYIDIVNLQKVKSVNKKSPSLNTSKLKRNFQQLNGVKSRKINIIRYMVLFQTCNSSVTDVNGEWQAAVYVTLCCSLLFSMFPVQKWSWPVTDCTDSTANISWWYVPVVSCVLLILKNKRVINK